MPLPTPKLDDRRFQDLVDEAKKRIPHYCKEWTDHNVSDPGVTMIELFAWLTDLTLFRLNQVPDLHYIRFMDMLGITLQEPLPAQTDVTFWLTKPQETVALIPAGTEVASTQTETEPSIVFTTDTDFRVHPPQWNCAFSEITGEDRSKHFVSHNLKRLQTGFEGFEVFSRTPLMDDALYFGFENDLSHHILGLELECDPAGGTGIDPSFPPYVWEASTGSLKEAWQPCIVDSDTTKGLNHPGKIILHLPRVGKSQINNNEMFWLRVRIQEITPALKRNHMQPYRLTPRIEKVAIAAWGGSVPATHAQLISQEMLGRSDGSPGQRFQLQMPPVLKRRPGETLVLQLEGEAPQPWKEVPDFADSGAEDRHFCLDGVSGEVRFGPAIRQPDGTIKLYGAIPPRSANIVFERYRHGGGQEGNVEAGVLNTLKTAIPYIERVVNRKPAYGGVDAETLEAAMARVPALLRSRQRAVTEADYEFLARQALPGAIGRVKCLQPRAAEGRVAGRVDPSLVYVLVIPRMNFPAGRLDRELLKIKPEDKATLTAYLDERRLLTTRVDVRDPAYYWVSIEVQLRAAPNAQPTKVEADVLARLYAFINPLTGGPEKNGWPFGRSIYLSDIYPCLQGIADVLFVRSVEMYPVQEDGRRGNPVESIELVAHGVVASALHHVTFV
jgi:predicted phage baseplate assembly protein